MEGLPVETPPARSEPYHREMVAVVLGSAFLTGWFLLALVMTATRSPAPLIPPDSPPLTSTGR